MITEEAAKVAVMDYLERNNKWYKNWKYRIAFREKENYEMRHAKMMSLIKEKCSDRFDELKLEFESMIDHAKDVSNPDQWLFIFQDPDRSIISPSGVTVILNCDDGSIEEFVPTI